MQFKHLNKWEQGLPCLVSNLEGLVFGLALQHQENWQWCSVICRPLHFTHFDLWTLYDYILCPHFQHFLYCGTLEFLSTSQIIAIKLLKLKYLLINPLALELLCKSQMSSHMMVISDFGDILIILGLEASEMLLKM